ncbi:unnamed protein product [Rhizophagus irregularis]|nr:unnamed protein product [Rhizophagus irregularis]
MTVHCVHCYSEFCTTYSRQWQNLRQLMLLLEEPIMVSHELEPFPARPIDADRLKLSNAYYLNNILLIK